MKVELTRVNDAVHFKAETTDGKIVHTDGAESVGGEGKGMRPMQLMLVSIASCSGIDVVEILKKQRQKLENLYISVSGERATDSTPSPFTSINIHFTLFGDLDKPKVVRALRLAVDEYCSARATLSDEVEVNHSFEIKSAEETSHEK